MLVEESSGPTYEMANGVAVKRIWQNFANGKIPLDELDNEELARMQVRDKRGTFIGMPPRIVPRELAQAHARELVMRNDKLIREMVLKATQVFDDVMQDDEADNRDKMAAARYVLERFLGKIPDKVEVTAEIKPWQGLVEGILVKDSDVKSITNAS